MTLIRIPFRVLITLLITYLLSPLTQVGDSVQGLLLGLRVLGFGVWGLGLRRRSLGANVSKTVSGG